MKMDTSFWIRCNPKVTVEHTTKKYFGKFLYKVVLYCPAGRLIDSKGPMYKELEHRKSIYKHINQSGWWGARQNRDLDHADMPLLETMRGIRKNSVSAGIKLRVEEPRIQIYAATEDELVNLVIDHLQPFVKHIESIAGPANEEAAEVLNSGAIIRKTDNGYTHKVILRDGRYSLDVKDAVLKYLDNLQIEMVGVPGSCRTMFTKSTSYIWNCYFYTNDPSVITFLNLIQPGLVSNIHELVVAR
jgi:hypothetical protein